MIGGVNIYRDNNSYGSKNTNGAGTYMITSSTCRGAISGVNNISGIIIEDRGLWDNKVDMMIST